MTLSGRTRDDAKRHQIRAEIVLYYTSRPEDVQYLAGHSNPQTTQIYDRRRRRATRNIVERISI